MILIHSPLPEGISVTNVYEDDEDDDVMMIWCDDDDDAQLSLR